MHDVVIGALILMALLALDVLAMRFGTDSRRPPDAWW
jgi:hypothetical protein